MDEPPNNNNNRQRRGGGRQNQHGQQNQRGQNRRAPQFQDDGFGGAARNQQGRRENNRFMGRPSFGTRNPNNGFGGNHVPNRTNNGLLGTPKTGSDRVNYGIKYEEVKDLCDKLDSHELLVGSSDLLQAVLKPSIFYRFDQLDDWRQADKQANFLRLLVAATSSTQSDKMNLTKDLLLKLISSKLFEFIDKEHIIMLSDSERQLPPYTTILHNYVELLLIGLEHFPSKMDDHRTHIESLQLRIFQVKNRNPDFPPDETKELLKRLDVVMEAKIEEQKNAVGTRQKAKQRGQRPEFHGSEGAPPENYRQLSVFPTDMDLTGEGYVYLRPAKNKGKYEDCEQYLDVQFRLLRQDLVRPLRDGIQLYHAGELRKAGLYVYKQVTVGKPSLYKQTGELLSTIQLKVHPRMRWNKRLKFGCLVCLSSDNFHQNFVFGVVKDRKPEELQKGRLMLKIEDSSMMDFNATYQMVESPAFFEAYRHVLTALQSVAEGERVPFSRYLVNVETAVNVPQYLDRTPIFDFSSVLTSEAKERGVQTEQSPIQNPFRAEDFGMDESQFDAFLYALRSELAIIQGPPGTGKTWIGLQIARLLLENMNSMQHDDNESPMLVVCYTNHALDQFLEGISKFMPEGIIRIGSQSKNTALDKYSLNNIRKDFRYDPRINNHIFQQLNAAKHIAYNIAERLAAFSEQLQQLKSGLASFETLAPVILPLTTNPAVIGNNPRLVKWLTYDDCPVPFMNVWKIQSLMRFGFQERVAKIASLLVIYQDAEIEEIAIHLRTNFRRIQRTEEWVEAHKKQERWPLLQDIGFLVNHRIPPQIAIQLLVSYPNTPAREVYYRHFQRAQQPKNNQQGAQIQALMEQMEIDIEHEDDMQLLQKEDEERRAQLGGDENILEGFDWVSKNKEKKETFLSLFGGPLADYTQFIVSSLPMNANEARNVNLSELGLLDRWRFYRYCIEERIKEIHEAIPPLQKEYTENVNRSSELRAMKDVEIMRTAKVVGMTTTGAAIHQAALRSLKPQIVIVEEAAEVLEAHLIVSLTTACEHAILIGDHKQLRPNPTVYEHAKKYNMDLSLFERLINNDYPHRMLKNQHRMRPTISRTLMPHFYSDLMDDESVNDYPDVLGMNKNVVFLNHSKPEEATDDEFKSHSNVYEAKMAIRLAKYLIQQGYKHDKINILCTYLDQLLLLRKLAPEAFGGKDHNIRIENVDNYQGEECDIIILSLVRGANSNGIGYLTTENRVCVALSRAKHGFYVLGNLDFFAEKAKIWAKIRESLAEADCIQTSFPVKCLNHGEVQEISDWKEFDEKCPEGGCRTICDCRLECGHKCRLSCHPKNADHRIKNCIQKCAKKCENGHPCEKICKEECGNCNVKVQKQLPCGHETKAPCFKPVENIHCNSSCNKNLPCGHVCPLRCYESCATYCKEMVEKQLPCGHKMQMECSKDPSKEKCKEKVEKTWPVCRHKTEANCSDDPLTTPCPKPCGATLDECEHTCSGKCGTCRNGRLHIQCKKDCKRLLICGHECKSKCSKVCPPCEKPCETRCSHSKCNQAAPGKGKVRKGSKNAGRICGKICAYCVEECSNSCQHRQCKNKCWEPCNVKPCHEPCDKKLKCSTAEVEHKCLGMCGEDCLDVCRICNPEKFEEMQEIFFGTEEDEDAHFIKLMDCDHIFEVKGFDQWIQSQTGGTSNDNQIDVDNANENLAPSHASSTAIIEIFCPKCKTPIRQSNRYVDVLSKRMYDIQQIKFKLRGAVENVLESEFNDFKTNFGHFVDESRNNLLSVSNMQRDGSGVNQFCEQLLSLKALFKQIKQGSVSSNLLTTYSNIHRIMEQLVKHCERVCKTDEILTDLSGIPTLLNLRSALQIYICDGKLRQYLFDDINSLAKVFGKDVKNVSEFMINQATLEIHRNTFLIDMMTWISKAAALGRDIDENAKEFLFQILELTNGTYVYNEENQEKIKTRFERLSKLHPLSGFGLTEQDRIAIVNALSGQVTSWYKCPNGHIYGIGNCGQAMERSQCPECKATIGGTSHQLNADNSQANDVMRQGIPQREYNPFEARW